ncbi:unnamed protein product [Arabidopsis arenosa]|uniref:Large ribosomal subunit protein mL54 n=1 Tax=Arabidopsis arenosa TaxID=38785 RepID=A0A8S1ZW76_ARAAE|nr:unnamed protein product [Arabidopsis arenosa]
MRAFSLAICVLILAMLIMVAESSYGGNDEKRTPPPPPMAPSPSPTGHFGEPKTLPPPPNAATFPTCPLFITTTLMISEEMNRIGLIKGSSKDVARRTFAAAASKAKKDGSDPKILPDSDYPDWLWHLLDKRPRSVNLGGRTSRLFPMMISNVLSSSTQRAKSRRTTLSRPELRDVR